MGFCVVAADTILMYILNIIFWKYGFLDYFPKWSNIFGEWELNYLILFCFIIALVKQVLVILGFYINGMVKNKAEYIYRDKIIENLDVTEGLESEKFTAFSYHTEKISQVIVFSCLAFTASIQLLSYIGYSVYIAPKSFLLVGSLGVFLVLPIIYLERKSVKVNKNIFNLKDALNNRYLELVRGHSYCKKAVYEHSKDYMNNRIFFDILNGFKRAYPELIGICFVLLLLVFHDSNLVSTDKGKLITFFYFMLKISQTLSQFNFHYAFIRLNYEGYQHAAKFLEKKLKIN